MRVLFVDDEEDIRDLIEIAIITEEDIDATFAASGAEAISLLEKETFDLIVLDVMMPPPNGLDVLRIARSRSDLDDTKIVMCTAKTSVESEQELRSFGADHVLHKPFKPLKLTEFLRKVV